MDELPGNDHDAIEGVVEIFERGSAAKSPLKDIRLRIERFLRDQQFDLTETKKRIWEDIQHERKTKKKQQPGPYNQPPAKLRREFESSRRVGVGKGQKAPDTAPYKMMSPVERWGSTDMNEDQLQAFIRFQQNALRAKRGPRVTAVLDASGGGGTRSGGVRDADRLAYASHLKTMTRLPWEWHPMIDRLVEGAVTAVEIGRWLVPAIKEDKSLRAVGRAWIKSLAMQLHHYEIEERGLRRVHNESKLREQVQNEIAVRRRRSAA